MEFEWDEDKRLSNIEKHNLDFVRLRQMFDGRPTLTAPAISIIEERWITTGEVERVIVSIIWTKRGDAIRLISARRARNAEKRAYRALHR